MSLLKVRWEEESSLSSSDADIPILITSTSESTVSPPPLIYRTPHSGMSWNSTRRMEFSPISSLHSREKDRRRYSIESERR